jgi:primosomal protein N' (replication factor Y)
MPTTQPTDFALEKQGGFFVRVILDGSGGRIFDYAVPEGVEVSAGARVRVPVRMRTVLGTVLEVTNITEASGVRFVHEVLRSDAGMNPALLQLGVWMAEYYCCPLETALKSVLPQVIRKSEMTHQQRQIVKLLRMPEPETLAALERRAPLQWAALKALEEEGCAVPVIELSRRCDASHAVGRALEKKGWVAVDAEHRPDVFEPPLGDDVHGPAGNGLLSGLEHQADDSTAGVGTPDLQERQCCAHHRGGVDVMPA